LLVNKWAKYDFVALQNFVYNGLQTDLIEE